MARAGKELTEADNLAQAVRLTSAFYSWERRGRGWDVWPQAVDLEPPFTPFVLEEESTVPFDDARRPTLIGGWLDSLFGKAPEAPSEARREITEPEATPARRFSPVEIQIALAPDVKVTADVAEHLLLSLSTCTDPISFEIVGTSEAIVVQFATSEKDAPHVRQQLQAHFPDAVISEASGYLADALSAVSDTSPVAIDFGLSQEFMRPLKTFSRFDADPLIGIAGNLGDLLPGDVAVVQVLFQTTRAAWSPHILRSVQGWNGEDFFLDAPEFTALAKQKVNRPLFAVVLRIGVKSQSPGRAWLLAQRIGGTFAQFADPASNELLALDNDGYPDTAHIEDIALRRSRRTGAILNSEELVSFVHPPSTSVRSARLKRDEGRTKAAPKSLQGHGLILGSNVHAGLTRDVGLEDEQRLRHMHVVGASGTGKSTLLMSLLVQDIEHGNGFAVLDPHGDLIDELLCRIPESRAKDVVLVDPADTEYPVGFNILSAHSELEKTLLASDLVAVFRRLSTSWGDQMTSVLSNAVLAFLESSRGGTLADLRHFLVEAEYRKDFLETVRDPEVVYYWQKEFPLLSGRPQAPLLTRLDSFLRPQLVRSMVTQPTALDFASIMNEGKILLVKLAQGAIGEENAALLGSLFVSKIHQTALGRQAIKESDRRPFYVYMDEFQHFVTPSMATLLTGARKYRVGLVLAHQELRQLLNQDRDVGSAVLANAATRICFRVGDDDAKRLEDGFSSFSARDIQNLGRGQAICRVDRADWDFSLRSVPSRALDAGDVARAPLMVQASREQHATRSDNEEAPVVPRPAPALRPVPVATSDALRKKRADSSRSAPDGIEAHRAVRESILAGRGGAQHKYLQELVRRWAEANGWRATIEKPILDGLGSVDIALERGDLSVACEIGISTTAEHEVQNIHKCLSAGFTHAVSIVPDARKLATVKQRLAVVLPDHSATVLAVSPDGLFELLNGLTDETKSTNNSFRGYRVAVKKGAANPRTAQVRRGVLAKVVSTALARLKS